MSTAISASTVSPQQDLETLSQWGTENLARVIAIDSQSDERSDAVPSSPGQRQLSDFLRAYFEDLGYVSEQDDMANLLVTIPANVSPGSAGVSVALMVHMDTAEGTRAVPGLEVMPSWNGEAIRYPGNSRLTVTAERYPEIAHFVGDDVLHGPGTFPIGLDDKLGMAELMTLAQVLAKNPEIPHGELVLVFRPDEEIGRMAAVEGLAKLLAERGVRYGYTIDGILPFEVNVANFNASAATVAIPNAPLTLAPAAHARRLEVAITGVNTHGATAKAEGHLNGLTVIARAMAALGMRPNQPGTSDIASDIAASVAKDIVLVAIQSDDALECNASASFLVRADDNAELDRTEAALRAALAHEVAEHAWKGARCEVSASASAPAEDSDHSDAAMRFIGLVQQFVYPDEPAPAPLLPEDSGGNQGYSNPFAAQPSANGLTLRVRLRDFDTEGLKQREQHLRELCAAAKPSPLTPEISAQYINMGAKLAAYPELIEWAQAALSVIGRSNEIRPIRGGTGVDPFLEHDIPVANLGTGYFAPESEKELTSRQNIARHTEWLTHLVQVIAAHSAAHSAAGPA